MWWWCQAWTELGVPRLVLVTSWSWSTLVTRTAQPVPHLVTTENICSKLTTNIINRNRKKILEYFKVFVDNVTNVNPLNPVDTIHGHNQLHSLTVLILRNCHEPPITPHCLYTALYCTSSSDKLSPEYYISIIISFFLIL